MQSDPVSGPSSAVPPRQAPTRLLMIALALALATIAGVGAYTFTQIRDLRDQQTEISERNRKDSLQLLRIQNDLSSLGAVMRDMAEGVEPYPLVAYEPTLQRLRGDLTAAIAQERTLAPAEREPASQERLNETVNSYGKTIDRIFELARTGDSDGAVRLIRTNLIAQHRELDSTISQFLILNNRAQEEAARANRGIYDRVGAELLLLVAVLLVVVAIAGTWIVAADRRAFKEVQRMTAQLRTLSWHTLRMQEDLQRSVSRELHDDFGQIMTAIGTLLGRIRRHLPQNARLAEDVDQVRAITHQALERVRTQSQWLHPGVLDDFGLERALERFVEQYERQTGISTTLTASGPLGGLRDEYGIHVYRIVQEALSNISRHSHSTEAHVRVACANGGLELSIEDRGTGLPAGTDENAVRGLGLVSMRERAELMGGQLRLRRPPQGGLAVEVRVPNCVAEPQGVVA